MYNSVQELLMGSAAVVRVTAMSAVTEKTATIVVPTIGIAVDGVPFTVTTVRVDQVLYGSVSGSEIEVHQNGARGTNVRTTDSGPLMEVGKSYVLFLQQPTGPGRIPNRYFPVGGPAGVYAEQGGTLGKTDKASLNLPDTLSLPDLQRTISVGVSTAVVPSAVTTAGPMLPPTPSR